ncbi:TIGR03032 family protein [Photobacterium halotolerans]|uniref:TIGR03032 family protein n=1 Tax=Photobacterium halotolerans TaxID=265726 RepID=UPI000695D345|nr:TIGR03032 family protein [Photobacterium halotolerans]
MTDKDVKLNYGMTSCARFPLLLKAMKSSLLVSAHNLDCLFVISSDGDQIQVEHVRLPQLQGIALSDDQQRLSLAAYHQVWDYQRITALSDLHISVPSTQARDAVYYPCGAMTTGYLNTHDLAWGKEKLYMVNTRFNCIASPVYGKSFEVVWQPPFISALVAEDRCHLNGLALKHGEPAYVSYFSATDHRFGWREGSSFDGAIMRISDEQAVIQGLCLPHSPRIHQNYLYFCESGTGRLWRCSEARLPALKSDLELVAELNGFTRGLRILGDMAFVGLSKVRKAKDGSSRHIDMPLLEKQQELRSGICVIDLRDGSEIASLTFSGDLNQIYDVEIVFGCNNPLIFDSNAEELSDLFQL